MYTSFFKDKKRLAREWLLFVTWFFSSTLLLPVILYFIAQPDLSFGTALWEVYYHLLQLDRTIVMILATPYLLFTLVRSIIWSVKSFKTNVRAKEWLSFLVFGLVGLLVMPVFKHFFPLRGQSKDVLDLYGNILDDYTELDFEQLIYLLVPYILFLIVRTTLRVRKMK